MPKPKNTRLSVFKGREARLNRAIFQALALKGPQTIYNIHKQMRMQRGMKRTHYGNVNKRVRVLQQSGYIIEARVKCTKAGFEATVYELTGRGYLAMLLNSISLDEVLGQIDENSALQLLTTLTGLLT